MSNVLEWIHDFQGQADISRLAQSLEHTGRIRSALIARGDGVHIEEPKEGNFKNAETIALACGRLLLAVIAGNEKNILDARNKLERTNESMGNRYHRYSPTAYTPISEAKAYDTMHYYSLDMDLLAGLGTEKWLEMRFLRHFSLHPRSDFVMRRDSAILSPLSLDYMVLSGASSYLSKQNHNRWAMNLAPVVVSPDSRVVVFPGQSGVPVFNKKKDVFILDEGPFPIDNLLAIDSAAREVYPWSVIHSAARQ